ICVVGVVLLVGANLLRSLTLQFIGAGILLLTTTLAVVSQPSPLNVPVTTFWPMRIALVLLVACSWAFLLQPPRWLQRGIVAFALPSLAILLLMGGPTLFAQVFGGSVSLPRNTKFAPFWLAVDNQGTLYATDIHGRLVWVFDSSGNPQGTLSPALSPPLPTPGPGIMPTGFDENDLNLTGLGLNRITPTPLRVVTSTAQLPRSAPPNFDFCGIAVDPQGNLYLVDLYDPSGFMLLRFNKEG